MVSERELALLNLKYQDNLTYIWVMWTIAISFFIAIISYLLASVGNISLMNVLIILIVLVFLEVAFIAVYFFFNREKNRVRDRIELHFERS